MKKDVLPRIVRKGTKFSTWYVEFKVWNDFKQTYDRYRVRKGFAKCQTKKEAETNGWKQVKSIRTKINNGAYQAEQEEIAAPQSLDYQINVKTARQNGKTIVKLSIVNFMAEFLETARKKKLAETTLRTYTSKIRKMRAFLQDRNLNKIDIYYFKYEHAIEFMQWLIEEYNVRGKTYNEYIRLFRTVWIQAGKKRKGMDNPWREMDFIRNDTEHQKPISEQAIQRIKSKLLKDDAQMWLFCQFIYYCAARPKELRLMRIGDIDFERSKLIFRAELTKNRKMQMVNIPSRFLTVLEFEHGFKSYDKEDYIFNINGFPGQKIMSRDFMGKRFRKYRDELGLSSDVIMYGFKHTAAIKAVRNGVDMKELQNHNRHESLMTTDNYIKRVDGYESSFYIDKMPEL